MHDYERWLVANADAIAYAAILYLTVVWIFELIVHESAHMYFQRKYGVRVLLWRIGVGPTLLTVQLPGGTPLIIKIPIPLIGESRSLGELDDYERELGNPESMYYTGRSPLCRVAMAAAGPLVTLVVLIAICIAYQVGLIATGSAADPTVYFVFVIVGADQLLNLFVPFMIPRFKRGKRWQRNDALVIYEGLWSWLRSKN